MRNIFIFLLVPLLQGICCDDNDIEQKELTLDAADPENSNFLDNPGDIVVARPNLVFKNEKIKDDISFRRPIPRRERQSDSSDMYKGVECFTCYGYKASTAAIKCYKGVKMKTQRCSDFEQCYTELHPRYIKRGCILPSTLNRTFVCKCPLCNDKPATDLSYFNYRKFSDWQYDNVRLERPVIGMNLFCKICDTRGTNVAQDDRCKEGKNADYMPCGANQICYTNIDNEIDFVSRGCVDVPAYNSMFFFCNKSMCNSERIPNPHTTKYKYKFQKLTASKAVSFNIVDTLKFWHSFISLFLSRA